MRLKTFFALLGGVVVLAAVLYVVYSLWGIKHTLNNSDLPQSSSTPLTVGIPTTTPITGADAPVTLSAYNNSQYNYKVLYSSDFTLFTQSQIAAYNFGSVDGSACDRDANSCFVLDKTPYANTNLDSAVVSVKILSSVTTPTACAAFDPNEIAGGHTTSIVSINGITFLTAVSSDAGAGNFYETHYNRTWYGNNCVEVNAIVHSTDPGVYDPPRPEFNANEVWYKLQLVINSFQFVK
jgi:hypothetical protein